MLFHYYSNRPVEGALIWYINSRRYQKFLKEEEAKKANDVEEQEQKEGEDQVDQDQPEIKTENTGESKSEVNNADGKE